MSVDVSRRWRGRIDPDLPDNSARRDGKLAAAITRVKAAELRDDRAPVEPLPVTLHIRTRRIPPRFGATNVTGERR